MKSVAAILAGLGLMAATPQAGFPAGAAVPAPVVMSLNGGGWAIHPEDGPARAPEEWATADAGATGWTAARVPGNLQADLESAGQLRPLWYGAGDERIWEIPRSAWWYRKDFAVPADWEGRRLTLVFGGVDPECEVWLNGRKIGGESGMFRPFQFDVTDAIRAGATNRLAVRLPPMPPELERYLWLADRTSAIAYYGDTSVPGFFPNGIIRTRQVLNELKSPTNFGWDWGVCIWTMGIWKDVRLEASGAARVNGTRLRTELSDQYRQATVLAEVEVNAAKPVAVRVQVRVTGPGADRAEVREQALAAGDQVIALRVPIERPALWWPNGQGDQPLYHAEVTLADAATGQRLDARRVRFGIREIRWTQVEGAPADFINPFRLLVNGRPVRLMGSNLIPPDLLFGRILERGPLLLRRAREAGMNTLRLWGGGVILPPEMYDLADELGIMLSLEFPLANSWPETNAVFLANLEQTITRILKQTRNHPSIIEWTGGNEMPWQQGTDHPALHLLERLVGEHDGRIFRATCPIQGANHGPWVFDPGNQGNPESYNAAYAHYDGLKLMRHGEFGTSGPAHLEVWHRTIPPELHGPTFDPKHPVILRKKLLRAVFSDPLWLGLPQIERFFGPQPDLPALVRAGQFLAAEGLRYAMDAHRRRGGRLGGFMSWNFNEPWPNGAGSYLVDYDGRPLMNYDFVAQALAPVSLSLRYDSLLYDPAVGVNAQLFLTSDAPQTLHNVRWQWLARDRRGQVLARGDGRADIPPLAAKPVASIAVRPPPETAFGPLFVELRLDDSKGVLLAERLHLFGLDGVSAPLAGLLHQRVDDAQDNAGAVFAAVAGPKAAGNFAYVGHGAKPATASSARPEPIHQPPGLNDGAYGNDHSWIGTTPRASFQIDLGKTATVGQFKLGRDRTGRFQDRGVDHLQIETSLDGQTWQTVFQQTGITSLPGFSPVKTLTIDISPVEARFVRATVDPKDPAAGELVCIDEFESHGPAEPTPAALPQLGLGEARPEIWRSVRPTTLEVTAAPPHREGDRETLELTVRNTGPMTALFCEVRPLAEYRTDLFLRNHQVSIPPGEARTITICSAATPAGGLQLAQIGWRIGAWNADERLIEPSGDVLLAVGRRDGMCREFAGYGQPPSRPGERTVELNGRRPDAARLPYLLGGERQARFRFEADPGRAQRPARLRIHLSDRDATADPVLQVVVNGRPYQKTLARGLGIQQEQPYHLAFPVSLAFDLPAGLLKAGDNRVEVSLANSSWVTWDALDLVTD